MPKFKIQKKQLKEIMKYYKKEHSLNYSKLTYDQLLNKVIELGLKEHIDHYEELNKKNYHSKKNKGVSKETEPVKKKIAPALPPALPPVSRETESLAKAIPVKKKRIAPTQVSAGIKKNPKFSQAESNPPNSSKKRVEEVIARWDKIHEAQARKSKQRNKK